MESNYNTFTSEVKSEPMDRNKAVYFTFYYTGLTILFPYTMLITMTDFWTYKLRDTSLPFNSSSMELTEAQKQFPNQLAMSGNVPLTLLVLLTMFFGHHVSLRARLLSSLMVEVVGMATILLLAGLDTDLWQHMFVIIILIVNAAYSSANAVFQASFLGNLGRFPAGYIGGANDGMGLGTALPALVAVLVLATSPPATTLGLAGIATSLLSLVIQVPATALLSTSPFYRHHSGAEVEQRPSPRDFLEVLGATWTYQVAILLDYTATLAVHPAVTALVRPSSPQASPWHDRYFVAVSCFLAQALADWLGRSMATWSQRPRPGRTAQATALAMAILRTALIPLIMLCNVAPTNRSSRVLLPYDWAYVGLLVLFSVSGGFLSNLCYMVAPQGVEGRQQEVVGLLLTTCLVLGLGIGSLIGPVLVSLL